MSDVDLSPELRRFIEESDSRIYEYLRTRPRRRRGFVASDLVAVKQALERVVDTNLAPGPAFLEWGSGFGGVTVLASMFEFDAYGIEIQGELVEAARELAQDFGHEVVFTHGTYVPAGAEELTEGVEYTWWDTGEPSAYEELGMDPEDFDVFFAYPWPGEEQLIDRLYTRYASVGSLLVTYHGVSGVRLLTKNDPSGPPHLIAWI